MEAAQRTAADLQRLLGPDRVTLEPEACRQRALDTWPLHLALREAGSEFPAPVCVVRPRSTQEVARALAFLYSRGMPVVPYGGGSGVAGGATAREGAAVVDLAAMDRICDLDRENQMLTVEAGARLGWVEEWLQQRGYTTGHYPQSIALAQMGGLVSTRSSGQFSGRYGSIEDLLCGCEGVLPTGEVLRLPGRPRHAVGPDLRHLWLGAEGTLGILTQVTVKVFPQPEERHMAAYALPDMRRGLAVLRSVLQSGWRPAVARLHDPTEARRHFSGAVAEQEAILLLLSEGPAAYAQAEGEALDSLMQSAGARPLGPEPVAYWLRHRNDAVRELNTYIRSGMLVDTAEVTVSWTAAADLYEEVVAALRREVPELLAVSGHASHSYPQGTSLYFTFAAAAPQDPAAVERLYWSIWSQIMERTLAVGGSICHHHGIGKLRTTWVPAEWGSAYPVLQRIKAALDPRGLMNPGTLLPLPPGGEASDP